MKIYVVDNNDIMTCDKEEFYFVDVSGVFKSNVYTLKGAADRIKFLGSIGIEVDFSRSQLAWDCYL